MRWRLDGQEVDALTFEPDGSELETPNRHADREAPHDVIDVSDATGGRATEGQPTTQGPIH